MLSLMLLTAAIAAAADPVVHRLPVASSVFPQGARRGAQLEAEVLGEHLDRASTIVPFDKDLKGEILEAAPTRLRIRLSIAEKAAYGPHYFRIVTPRGASGPLLFRIGDLPRTRETEPNTTLKQAQPVTLPVTIDARLNQDNDFDFYRFRAKAGETWVFDLRAARNGNGLDSALILMTGDGVKLAHDEDHFVWDPFFTHTFAASGDYVAVVQPTHRSNDPNFAYELDIRQAPQLDTIAPISFAPGASVEATIHGAGLSGAGAKIESSALSGEVVTLGGATATVKLTVPATATEGPHELTLITAGGRSNPVRFLIDATPAHPGGERLNAPVTVNGIIRYRQPERFRFSAKKDETLVFEARANRFGSPADPLIQILGSDGKIVARNDDFVFMVADFYNKDPRLTHKFKEDGEYTLELRNLVNTTGENFPYQLRVTGPQPAFELSFASERPYIYPGKETKLKVTAKRFDGHRAAIPVELRGLPEGVRAEPAVIAEGKSEADVLLKADASLKPGMAAELDICSGGRAAWRPVRIASGGGEGATFARVDRALLTIAEKPSFSLEAAATNVSLPRGSMASIPVMIRREPDFTAPIRFKLENLPEGVSMEPALAEAGQDRIEIKLRAAETAAAGRAPRVAILGIAGTEQQEAPRISIQVD